MDKLKTERNQYLIWKSGEAELSRLMKLLKAYEYFSK